MANNDPSDEFVPVQGGNTGHSCQVIGLPKSLRLFFVGKPYSLNPKTILLFQGGGFSNTIDWNTLRGSSLSGPETAASGWIRNFDPYTQTPWLYNPSTSEYIS